MISRFGQSSVTIATIYGQPFTDTTPAQLEFTVSDSQKFDNLRMIVPNMSRRCVMFLPGSSNFAAWDVIIDSGPADSPQNRAVTFVQITVQLPAVHDNKDQIKKSFDHEYQKGYGMQNLYYCCLDYVYCCYLLLTPVPHLLSIERDATCYEESSYPSARCTTQYD